MEKEIRRIIQEDDGSVESNIKLPDSSKVTIRNITREEHKLDRDPRYSSLSQAKRIPMIAERLNLTERRVEELIQIRDKQVSLEAAKAEYSDNLDNDLSENFDDETPPNLLETVEAPTLTNTAAYVDVEQEVVGKTLSGDVKRVLEESPLNNREKEILKLRFGLDGNPPMVLEDVAKELSISPERVRQIEGRALAILRHPGISDEINPWVGDQGDQEEKIEGRTVTFGKEHPVTFEVGRTFRNSEGVEMVPLINYKNRKRDLDSEIPLDLLKAILDKVAEK